MSYESEWYSDPITQKMLTELRTRRNACLAALLGAAIDSTDPSVQKHASAIKTIDSIILEIERKSKKNEEKE